MLAKSETFDFHKSVAYNGVTKRAFHIKTRHQLKKVADTLGLLPRNYDLRSNQASIAVSGEITLHTDRLYVQVCQPMTGTDTGVLFRTCNGRKDYIVVATISPRSISCTAPRNARITSRRSVMFKSIEDFCYTPPRASTSGGSTQISHPAPAPGLELFHGQHEPGRRPNRYDRLRIPGRGRHLNLITPNEGFWPHSAHVL
jgi:hypothetical protein